MCACKWETKVGQHGPDLPGDNSVCKRELHPWTGVCMVAICYRDMILHSRPNYFVTADRRMHRYTRVNWKSKPSASFIYAPGAVEISGRHLTVPFVTTFDSALSEFKSVLADVDMTDVQHEVASCPRSVGQAVPGGATIPERGCTITISQKEADIEVRDFRPRPRSSSVTYDRIRPVRIPGVRVTMDVGDDTEEFALRMPTQVYVRIPLLHGLVAPPLHQASRGAGGSADTGASSGLHAYASEAPSRVDLPGTIWDFLTVLKVMLDPDWDGEALFLDDDDSLALRNAVQVRSTLGRVPTSMGHMFGKRPSGPYLSRVHRKMTPCAGHPASNTRAPHVHLGHIQCSRRMAVLPRWPRRPPRRTASVVHRCMLCVKCMVCAGPLC